MSARILLLAASALALTACATSKNNPVHKTTKYKGASPYSNASYSGSSSSNTLSGEHRTIIYGGSESGETIYGGTVRGQGTTIAASTQTYPATTTYSSGSSGYTTSSPYTGYTTSTPSSYSRVDESCLRKERTHEYIGAAVGGTAGAFAGKEFIGGTAGTVAGAALGGTLGYGLGDKSVHCDPVSVPVTHTGSIAQPYQSVTHHQTSTAYTAPTDRTYSGTGIGTPGYNAIHGSAAAPAPLTTYRQPTPTYVHPAPAARQNVYVPTQPLYAPTPTVAATAPYGAGLQHIVMEGDTVYRMSKNLCVTKEEIQHMNNLNAAYNIKVGQTLYLPAARC